jgi:hypothetical protein
VRPPAPRLTRASAAFFFWEGIDPNESFSSEGVQIGGVRSSFGVLGAWTTTTHELGTCIAVDRRVLLSMADGSLLVRQAIPLVRRSQRDLLRHLIIN